MAKSRLQVFPAIKADASPKEVPAAPGLSRNDSVREHGRFAGARQTTGRVSTTRSPRLAQIRSRLRPRVLRLSVGPVHPMPTTVNHEVAYINSGSCAPSVSELKRSPEEMTAPAPDEILAPWEPVSKEDGPKLVAELKRELRPDHLLSGASVEAVARRRDCDDVLFVTDSKMGLLALVHLTWSGKPDQFPQWPHTVFFQSWAEWMESDMHPAHEEYK